MAFVGAGLAMVLPSEGRSCATDAAPDAPAEAVAERVPSALSAGQLPAEPASAKQAARYEGITAEAPIYPPARTFEAPVRIPYRLTAKAASFRLLMDHPAAWAIALKEVPVVAVMVKAPGLQPFLSNFSLQNAQEIGLTTQAAMDRVDKGLQALEPVR